MTIFILILNIIFKYGLAENNINDKIILRQILHYSQTQESCNAALTSYSNLNEFTQDNYDEIYNTYTQNVELCESLNLTSPECETDCVYYLSPMSLFLDNTTNDDEIMKVINWYQMGGGPIGWYATGNPSMCKYMDGTYCYTPLKSPAGVGVLALDLQQHGCCVPGTCVNHDAVKVLQQNEWCYQGYNELYNEYIYGGLLTISHVCEQVPRNLSSSGFLIVVSIFSIFVILVLIASIKTQWLTETYHNHNDIHTNPFLACFSIQYLWKSFINIRPENKSDFNFLDGIRVISMAWVIWGHVFSNFTQSSPANLATLVPINASANNYKYVVNHLYMMLAEYGFYAVDSFYFLSGFLGAFSLHRQLKSHKNTNCYIFVLLSYIHRILRLLPMMAFVLLIEWYVVDQLSSGYRVESRTMNQYACNDRWYKILLFYDNLIRDFDDNTCCGWVWYVHTDMQMFLMLPWIILLFEWNKIFGLIMSLIPFVICIIIRTYFAIYYHFQANQIVQNAYPIINGGNQQGQYFRPWTRMAPYFIGTFTLLLIMILKQKQYHFEIKSRVVYFFFMMLSCFILCCLVFWPYEDVKDAPENRWSLVSNQIYYSLSRPVWGIALGLMSFVLVFKTTRLKSIIGIILSLSIYQPLGKLTYTMYLIHMIVIKWYYKSLDTFTYYELWTMIVIFIACLFITMCLTIILWFIVEKPMANVIGMFMKWIVSKNEHKKKQFDKKMDAEMIMTNIKNDTNNGNMTDKLLAKDEISNNNNNNKDSISATIAGAGNCYQSCVDIHDDNEYESIKSN